MRVLERTPLHGIAAAAALLAVAACGGGEQAADGDGDTDQAQQQAGPVVPPDSAATVNVTVNFEGSAPAPEPIDMSAEESCAAAYGDEGPTMQTVVASDGKLQNAFVYVKSSIDRDFPTPSEPVTLDQEDCRYHPHVLGIQAGQPLEILNSDSLLHNINAQPSTNRGFNISQPQAGMSTTRDFALQEVMIPVQCDVHGWMSAYIGVVENPYHGVSDASGALTLENLPPGEHVVEAWHEEYGTMTDTVTVAAAGSADVSFTYSADMAGADVPLGEPLIVHHGGAYTTRGEAR